MKRAPLFITGTDTGVGKTVLAALLAAFLRQTGVRVAACKPVCSGGREDARLLAKALGGSQTLAEINPWHFRAPIAPVLSARQERRKVALSDIVAHCGAIQKSCAVLVVEGAGGLLSPLGEDVDSQDLIAALRATPIIVGVNRLGVVNHVRLTLAALPAKARAKSFVVLMAPEKPDASTGSNRRLLAEFFDGEKIIELPWLGPVIDFPTALKDRRVRKTLVRLID